MQTIVQHRVVMGKYLNDQRNLFGGYALKWMDEVAYLTAGKFTNQRMVTVCADRIRFYEPVREGSVLQLEGKLLSTGMVRTMITVEIWLDGEPSTGGRKVIEGQFTFVAVDDNGKLVRLTGAADSPKKTDVSSPDSGARHKSD